MNGRFMPAGPDAGPYAPRLWPWSDGADTTARLLAALALSCLLHAAAVFLPFLGTPTVETGFAHAGRGKPPPVLNATLVPAAEREHAVRKLLARAEPAAQASAAERPADAARPVQRRRAEGTDLLPLEAHPYYTTNQLTKRPQPLAAVDLDAPQIRSIVASGKLVLKLWINEFGVVADIAVEESGLPEVFSRTAVAAFRELRFTPGERNAQPVGTVMRIEVTYDDGRMRAF